MNGPRIAALAAFVAILSALVYVYITTPHVSSAQASMLANRNQSIAQAFRDAESTR